MYTYDFLKNDTSLRVYKKYYYKLAVRYKIGDTWVWSGFSRVIAEGQARLNLPPPPRPNVFNESNALHISWRGDSTYEYRLYRYRGLDDGNIRRTSFFIYEWYPEVTVSSFDALTGSAEFKFNDQSVEVGVKYTYVLSVSLPDHNEEELGYPETGIVILTDGDGDGIWDSVDNCLSISNTNQLNTDSDNQGNACDLDDDNDGIFDVWEIKYGLNALFAGDALLDADKDGATNLAEYKANTNPKTNEPAVAVQSILYFMNKPKKKSVSFILSPK